VDVEQTVLAPLAGADDLIGTGCFGDRWYVVHAQPRAESKAAFHLARQSYSVFWPRFAKVVRHARRRTETLAPLFPGYLFLSLDVSRQRWRSVNGTCGVVRLIMQGERPQPVPRGVVEALQIRTGADGVMNWSPSFEIGQSVAVVLDLQALAPAA
jgi:transcription antitermination factor NusG